MKGEYLVGSSKGFSSGNIFADKSSLVLNWLLRFGIQEKSFSIRDVSQKVGISLGLVHRVFSVLNSQGIIKTQGIRTAKSFILVKPKSLLNAWVENYSIIKKCKMWTYRSAYGSREEMLKVLTRSKLKSRVALALHSSAEAHKCKNNNLNTLELYLMDQDVIQEIEELLELEPQERGYDVLLIKPFYQSLLKASQKTTDKIHNSPSILTFLDLSHFPLRGVEQADYMADRVTELKKIYKGA